MLHIPEGQCSEFASKKMQRRSKRKRDTPSTECDPPGPNERSLPKKSSNRSVKDSPYSDDECVDTCDIEGDGDGESNERYDGCRDAQGRRHGRGTVTWGDGETVFEGRFLNGLREGIGKLVFADGSILSGRWKDDELEGRAVYVNGDGGVLDAQYHKGNLHGQIEERDADGFVTFRGHSYQGNRVGIGAFFFRDGGLIIGTMDRNGKPHGRRVAYVYPGHTHALYGHWSHGNMKAARFATCVKKNGHTDEDASSASPRKNKSAGDKTEHTPAGNPRGRCTTRADVSREAVRSHVFTGCMPSFLFDIVESQYNLVYRSDPSTFDCISSDPLLADPFESLCVRVGASLIDGAGEGLFAKRDFGADELVSIYGGIRLLHSKSDTRDWALNGNVMSVDDEICVDVPSPYDSTSHYVATLGHKANDDITFNSRYAPYTHPRYGTIKSVRTIRPVRAGEEITVSYDYSHVDENGVEDLPDWYAKRRQMFAGNAI